MEIMNIIEKTLSKNDFSRPCRTLNAVKAIILHWTGAPMQRAVNTWSWFESGCRQQNIYASAHYIIDLDGSIIHAIPDNEIAYHCQSSQADPASGKIYTDWARTQFGVYAEDPNRYSPNNCTIGIEMCSIDNDGNFDNATLKAAIELTAKLLTEHHLTINDVGTHHKVVGWKDCPRLWIKSPEKFEAFLVALCFSSCYILSTERNYNHG
jgi:N-acetylmuramoyl-L-alanine amidase